MTADVMRRLAGANPVRSLDGIDGAALFAQITASPGDPRLLDATTKPAAGRFKETWLRPSKAIVGIGVVAIAVVVFVVAFGEREQSAAAAELRRAATRLDAEPRPTLPAGSYWYVQTREAAGVTSGFTVDGKDRSAFAIESGIHEVGVANDGSGANYGTQLSTRALTDAGRRAIAQLHQQASPQPTSSGILLEGPKLIAVSLGNRSLTPANLASLPGDELALRRLIDSTRGNTPPGASKQEVAAAEFDEIASALLFEPFDPKVASALYRVLATIPGVHNRGPSRDALGRPGVALSVDAGVSRQTLLIDAVSGKLLERRETKIKSDAHDDQIPLGSTTYRATITATSIVPGVAIRPNGSHLDTSRWTVCKPRENQKNDLGAAHCVDPPA